MPDDEDGYRQRERRFRQLYEEHYRAVEVYAARRVDTRADVADVVSEVFTTAWRRLDHIPAFPADRLWLYGVARRVLAGRHRSARRLRGLIARLEASQAGHAQHAGHMPDSPGEQALSALRRLPASEREALMLVLWERLTHAEAAQVLGCSANAVAIRVHRARARLREALIPAGSPASRTSSEFRAALRTPSEGRS